jgi:hypothetical protein
MAFSAGKGPPYRTDDIARTIILGKTKRMELTTDEARFVQSYIETLEKQARHWWLLKIVAVTCLIIGLGLVFAVNQFVSHMKSDTDKLYASIKMDKVICTIEDMQNYVDAKMSHLKAEVSMNIQTLFVLMVGAALFVWTFSNTNKDKKYLLLAKFLRTLPDAHGQEIT